MSYTSQSGNPWGAEPENGGAAGDGNDDGAKKKRTIKEATMFVIDCRKNMLEMTNKTEENPQGEPFLNVALKARAGVPYP